MPNSKPKRKNDTHVPAKRAIAGGAPEVGPFAEIDAEEFKAAQRDPNVKRFAEYADRHVAALRERGKLK